MKILLLLNGRFPTQKAYGLQVRAMARGFAENGADVVVAFPNRADDAPAPLPGVRFVAFGPRWPFQNGWIMALMRWHGLFGLRRMLEEIQPDTCIVNDVIHAAFLSRPWKMVWDLHDVPDPSKASRRWLIRRVMRRAAGIISTNTLKLERLQKMGYALPPTVVLPNPVTFDLETYRSIPREAARQQHGLSETERAIVYAGQLYDWKGVDTLVASAAFLRAPDRALIIGGKGDDLERCKRIASMLPAGGAEVAFLGQRPAEEIPSWLRAADVVVIPNSGKHRLSVEDTNPLKAIEAMAAGACIVASDLPALQDALAGYPNAFFFKPDNAEDLARVIKTALEQPHTELAAAPSLLNAAERARRVEVFLRGIL